MRTALLIAGSTLALVIAAPAFAQTHALNGVTGAVPKVGALPSTGLRSTPTVKPRVGHSNRPSVKVRTPIAHAPLASGKTLAQVKAPRHPGDTRLLRVRTTSTRGLTGTGAQAALKRNGVQAVAVGHGTGLNTKRQLGVPLTGANSATSAIGGTGHSVLTSASNTGAGKALGANANGHGVLGANLVQRPAVITGNSGRKH